MQKRVFFTVEKEKIFKYRLTIFNMFEWLFGKKKVEGLKEDTKKGFESVKKDITSMSAWIKHLDSEKKLHGKELEEIKESLSSINSEIEGIKNVMAIMSDLKPNRPFRTPKQVFDKQTGVYAVQTGVQTGVQTPNLDQFSVTERAILWVLLNSDMRLSYDDLAAILGKERSTVRGHLNRIKQKSDGLIEEVVEKNGKKRVFIPENMKEKLLKRQKVRVRSKPNGEESKKE